jgi:hypothetical protein
MSNFSLGGMIGQVFKGKSWEGKKECDDDE